MNGATDEINKLEKELDVSFKKLMPFHFKCVLAARVEMDRSTIYIRSEVVKS